jgi:hypothetical protein
MLPQNRLNLYGDKLIARVERRAKPRVNCSYPVTLRGFSADGRRYNVRAILANMSASGMYLHTQRAVLPGERVFILVRLSTRSLGGEDIPHLAARGLVTRVEARVDTTYGVAVRLTRHRFL